MTRSAEAQRPGNRSRVDAEALPSPQAGPRPSSGLGGAGEAPPPRPGPPAGATGSSIAARETEGLRGRLPEPGGGVGGWAVALVWAGQAIGGAQGGQVGRRGSEVGGAGDGHRPEPTGREAVWAGPQSGRGLPVGGGGRLPLPGYGRAPTGSAGKRRACTRGGDPGPAPHRLPRDQPDPPALLSLRPLSEPAGQPPGTGEGR